MVDLKLKENWDFKLKFYVKIDHPWKLVNFTLRRLNQSKEIFQKFVGSVEKLFYLKTIAEFITLEIQSPVESEVSSETQNSCHFRSSVKISKFYVKPKRRNISETCSFHWENLLPEKQTRVHKIGVQSPTYEKWYIYMYSIRSTKFLSI